MAMIDPGDKIDPKKGKSMVEQVLPTTSEALREALISSAILRNWDEVDMVAPLAQEMPGDSLIKLFSEDTRDPRDDVRDGIMTAWFYINPQTPGGTRKHFEIALKVMQRDNHECAAIWAAMTVCRYTSSPRFGQKAKEALAAFKERVARMDEQEETTAWQETRDYIVDKAFGKVPYVDDFV